MRRWPHGQIEDPRDLEREIERAKRLATSVTDRLKAFVEELKQRLQQRLAARGSKEEIRARAYELWKQHGCPVGRDLEFWRHAEAERSIRKLPDRKLNLTSGR